jgi:hypothetical protein
MHPHFIKSIAFAPLGFCIELISSEDSIVYRYGAIIGAIALMNHGFGEESIIALALLPESKRSKIPVVNKIHIIMTIIPTNSPPYRTLAARRTSLCSLFSKGREEASLSGVAQPIKPLTIMRAPGTVHDITPKIP